MTDVIKEGFKFEAESLANVHSHLREGPVMKPLIELAVKGGADWLLPMPNTAKGLLTASDVLNYASFATSESKGLEVRFLPTLMINENTTDATIEMCANNGVRDAKILPRDRTTKSHNGARHYGRLISRVRRCGTQGVKVHLHPEHPWMLFDNRDAEFAFLPIADMFLNETNAIIVWEHGTDARCIPFWKEMATSGRFFLTLAAHHLATDEDQTFGDVRAVCKPPIKTARDRHELVRLVTEGHSWVMAGLDDAPHDRETKHISMGKCSCGAYTSPFGLQLYAHALDEFLVSNVDGQQVFRNFTSRNARRLHNLPPSSKSYWLKREIFQIPYSYQVDKWKVEPFWAGQKILYTLRTMYE